MKKLLLLVVLALPALARSQPQNQSVWVQQAAPSGACSQPAPLINVTTSSPGLYSCVAGYWARIGEIADDLSGATQYSVPYQTYNSTTGYLAPTTVNGVYALSEIVTGNVAVAPAWLNLSTYLASPPSVGATTPASGKFSSLTSTGATTLSSLAATSGAYCLQIDASGVVSNTGVACGSGSGGVNSVGISMPSQFTVSNSPITTSGSIAVTLTSYTGSGAVVLASSPTISGLSTSDILSATALGTSAAGLVQPSTLGMTTLGDTVYGGSSGAIFKLSGNSTTTTKYLCQTGDGTNSAAPSWCAPAATGVTSVGLSMPSQFTVSSSPVTSSGTIGVTLTDYTGSGSVVLAASPTMTGTPLAPTAASATSTTQVATTAFVHSLLSPSVQALTGTAPTTTYTLPSTGTVLGIFYNGVLLRPTTDYAVSSTTVTLTFTTATGDNLYAIFLN